MKLGTKLGSQTGRWIFLAALVVLLGALLLTTGPVGAQSDSVTVQYAEGATDPVAILTATDPEADDFTWELSGGYDIEYFEIDDETGVLSFKMPPDFEDPKDNGSNNFYVVEVKATDTDGNSSNDNDNMYTVTVEVTNVDEMGEVTWEVDGMDLMQFEVGAGLVASLTDGDVEGSSKVPSPITWQWHRSDSMADMGTAISGETGDSYTATSEDVGKYLRVMATYNVGGRDDETVYRVSEYPVLAEREDNSPPEFSSTSVTREVDEGMKGMAVGNPVTATDDGPGKLTYGLGGDDAAQFVIDRKTGQITTRVDLDYEAAAGDDANCETKNECEVTVTAYDSAGDDSTAATVAITIKNVNEAPKFTSGPKMIQTEENRTELHGNTPAPATAESDVTYEATDPEGGNVNLSLMGDDRARFELSDAGVLSFKANPDYEKPLDRNKDNVYEVTVRASDRTESTERMVRVTVMGINEPPVISGDDKVSYRENGTDPVFTFTANDPEGDTPIIWTIAPADDDPDGDDGTLMTVDAADAGEFVIEDGELKFSIGEDNDPPNFEMPRGEAFVEDSNTNIYKVVVVACDVQLTTAEPAVCPGANAGYHDVTVEVTNAPEEPKLTLRADSATGNQLREFDVGVDVFAVEDVNGVDGPPVDSTGLGTEAAFVFYRSSSRTSLGEKISPADDAASVAADKSHLLVEADEGKYIHVVYNYTIGSGDNLKNKSVRAVTDYRVAVARTTEQQAVPDFDPDAPERSVNEGAKGMKVGARVTAKDVANRQLFYSIDNDDTDGPDNANFDIDSKTGQITTAMALNYEEMETGDGTVNCASASDTDAERRTCTVTVMATNSSGSIGTAATTTATVTITIKNVNEAPKFENDLAKQISLEENRTALDQSSDIEESEVTFIAADPEEGNVTYDLRGVDAAKFQLDSGKVLSFKAKPDFEMPTDSNEDNVYEVTVWASDDKGLKDVHTVKVMVTNVNEAPTITGADAVDQPGTVTLSTQAPMAGSAITASLTDDDDGIKGPAWQWQKSMNRSSWMDITGAEKQSYTPAAADEGYYLRAKVTYTDSQGPNKMAYSDATAEKVMLPADEMGAVALSTQDPVVGAEITARLTDADGSLSAQQWQWEKSMDKSAWMDATGAGATTATYTPATADVGYYLRATVTYTDKYRSGMTAESMATDSMVIANRAPMFTDGETTTREIPENSDPGTDVGKPVTATDADADTLTYALSGDDAMYFTIDNMGQIKVGADTMLDYETTMSYMVTVTASDPDGETDSIDVTINVTDVVDEGPVGSYDTNGDGSISLDELFAAIDEYFAGSLSIGELFVLIDAYFANNG